MSDKPSFLGLLNAIAVGELGGEQQFGTWAEMTQDDEFRQVLRTVQLREAEHARSFAKRIDELGYSVLDRPDPDLARRMEIVCSTELSDCHKLERLGFRSDRAQEGRDIFASFFDDPTIDPVTGALMGRYIAEERDTGRLLRACHATLVAREPQPPEATEPEPSAEAALLERLDRIECAVMALAESAAAKEQAKAAKAAKKSKKK
jgi:hypothetical protein